MKMASAPLASAKLVAIAEKVGIPERDVGVGHVRPGRVKFLDCNLLVRQAARPELREIIEINLNKCLCI